MLRTVTLLTCLLLITFSLSKLNAQNSDSRQCEPKVCEQRIRQHIEHLASEKLQGRRGIHAIQAAEYVAEEFQKLNLQPVFKSLENKAARSYFQSIPAAPDKNGKSMTAGKNVAGLFIGCDARLKDEYIIVAAHHDHLGKKRDGIFFGADDNASGVAMVLEVARVLSTSPTPTKRSVLFVSFDLEEHLLFGSRWFTAHPPVPLKQVKMMIVADMLGRSLGDLPMDSFFLFGCEHAGGVSKLVSRIPFAEKAKPVLLSDDFVGTRSDYGPFRDRKIPFLFASTGQSKDYHTVRDTADKINCEQVTAISQGLAVLAKRLSNLDQAPVWIDKPKVSLAEVEAILKIVTEIEKKATDWKLNTVQRLFVSQARIQTKRILKNQKMSPQEQARLMRTTQMLLFTVF